MAGKKSDVVLKKAIIKILLEHVGKANAIDAGEIGRRVGIRENATHASTRGLITQIMRETDIPIGATGDGYFVLADEEEYNEYVGRLHNRVAGIEERMVNVKRAWNATYPPPPDDE